MWVCFTRTARNFVAENLCSSGKIATFAAVKQESMNFESLVGRINLIQDALQAQAAHAVNLSLTARNWLVGYYIVEFEQHGEDRAKYGEKLLKQLANSLNRRGLGERRLYEYRLTYQVYPQLGGVVAEYVFKNNQDEILRLPTAKLQPVFLADEKLRSVRLTFSTLRTQSSQRIYNYDTEDT